MAWTLIQSTIFAPKLRSKYNNTAPRYRRKILEYEVRADQLDHSIFAASNPFHSKKNAKFFCSLDFFVTQKNMFFFFINAVE